MKRTFGGIILVGTFTITVSCSTPSPSEAELNKYHALVSKDASVQVNTIRYQGIRDTALSFGARAGLAWRARQINRIVSNHERQLDLIYNFNGLMLEDNVLPPVLVEGRQTLDQTADDVIRVADRSYSIQSQARFVTMAPTWRDYLKMNYKEPEVPDSSLMPRNEPERTVWKRYLDEGWQAGISQADIIFAENLGRLKRDFEGIVRYRALLAQNMVSLPFVAQVNLGVTGGDAQMAINDRILKITALPEFNIATNEWKSVVTPEESQPTPDDSVPSENR